MGQNQSRLAQRGTLGLRVCWVASALLGLGCHSASAPPPKPAPGTLSGDPTLLDADVQAYAAGLQVDIAAAREQDASALAAQHTPTFRASLSYDPMQAERLDMIQSSALKLQGSELDALAQHGFALSSRQQYPTFAYGYSTIYSQDLPVYISADSIIDAVHSSYAALLKGFESDVLMDDLSTLLTHLRGNLQDQNDSAAKTDLDVYLAVAEALLAGTNLSSTPAAAQPIVALAVAAKGPAQVKLFGVERSEDFSQYEPRGHYQDDPMLSNYFRASMWLGRFDLRLVETLGDEQVVNREQAEAALLLGSLFDAAALARYTRIDQTLRLFVGESDNMTVPELSELLSALGLSTPQELASVSDDMLLHTILAHGFGKQQILNQLVEGGVDQPVPLSASFLLLGQRYTVDSHVFSNVVWDRTRVMRMLPNPLDVGFAALGNDQALGLLHDELAKYDYAGDLSAMRVLVDHYDDTFWRANLYNDWLSALRALSPSAAAQNLPQVANTEAWGRRILNTQLGSWAELRHDTILYNKQSYTSGAVCEFPDAAVDPYPEFYAAIARFAAHGNELLKQYPAPDQWLVQARDYFPRLASSAAMLQSIAETQAAHAALSAEQLAFINDAVVIQKVSAGCTSVDEGSGWFPKLYFSQADVLAFAPTIADVHTQPTDEAGGDIGRILHVATGMPRLMVVTLDGCDGARAYVGLTTSYYEKTTDHWQRLTDVDWKQTLMQTAPAAPEWLGDLVAQP